MTATRRPDRGFDNDGAHLTREFGSPLYVKDTSTPGVTYWGWSFDQEATFSQPKWRIRRRVELAGGITLEDYAGATAAERFGDYDQKWDDRASLFPDHGMGPAVPAAGVPLVHHDVSPDLVQGAENAHTYTVPSGLKLLLAGWLGSTSGEARLVVEVAKDGVTWVTLARRYTTCPPGLDAELAEEIPASGIVRLTRKNILSTDRAASGASFDVSTTILGRLVPA